MNVLRKLFRQSSAVIDPDTLEEQRLESRLGDWMCEWLINPIYDGEWGDSSKGILRNGKKGVVIDTWGCETSDFFFSIWVVTLNNQPIPQSVMSSDRFREAVIWRLMQTGMLSADRKITWRCFPQLALPQGDLIKARSDQRKQLLIDTLRQITDSEIKLMENRDEG